MEKTSMTTTDIDDIRTRDLIEKAFKLVHSLNSVDAEKESGVVEDVVALVITHLEEYRDEWSEKAYLHGYSDGQLDANMATIGKPSDEDAPTGC